MPLITRFTRLFQADLHAVLDRVEEPELALRQAIREMEEELAADAARLRQRETELQRLRARIDETESSLGRCAEELDLSFAADNESLAREVLRRRIAGEREQRQLEAAEAELSAAIDADRGRSRERETQLDELRAQADLVRVGRRAPGTGAGISDTDIELALLRERAARSAS